MIKQSLVHGWWQLVAAGTGFAVYCLLLGSGLLGSIDILFYRGVLLAGIAALVAGVAGALIAHWRRTPPLAIGSAITCGAICIAFLILFPVTIDRSVSVYLLATIDRAGGQGISPAALQSRFVAGYVEDMRAIDRRIAEQTESGNITVDSAGRVHLTARGRHFVALSRWAAARIGTDPRFVNGASPPPPH